LPKMISFLAFLSPVIIVFPAVLVLFAWGPPLAEAEPR
jgi:hypothetical protein